MNLWNFILVVLCALFLANGSLADNLLKNPGFEDPSGWSTNWSIKDAAGGNRTYHYHLTPAGGGHADAVPYSGENAVEIYSSDRQTYLTQKVNLEPGTYRLSAYIRANGMSIDSLLQLKLGDQQKLFGVMSQKYRLYWADFQIDSSGEYEVSLHNSSLGIAVDDLSLEKVDEHSPKPPALYIELFPSSQANAKNIQYCLKNSLQWVEISTTCIDSTSLVDPVMNILVSSPGEASGFNMAVLERYQYRQNEDFKLTTNSVERDGTEYTQYSFSMPRFVSGYTVPQQFGGIWLSNLPNSGGQMIVEITDSGNLLASETYNLVMVDPPTSNLIPKRYHILCYTVHNWKQEVEASSIALPQQFKMMGMNVWSDYGFAPEGASNTPTEEEKVRLSAHNAGIQNFWPNHASFMNVDAGSHYSSVAEKVNDADMYTIYPDGSVNKNLFNFNYAANRGKAWVQSALAAWLRTLTRPQNAGLPYGHTGILNDGLESIHYSYDPTTLAAFAKYKGVEAGEVNVSKLTGDWAKDWQLFNMELYKKVVDIWCEESGKIDPKIVLINTAGTYGPGGFGKLSPKENMAWAKNVTYNMPQWYANNYFGEDYVNYVIDGDASGIYDNERGGTSVFPLLNLSMGAMLADPLAFRFNILSFLSASKTVKGIGYYIGNYAFTDANYMVGISKVHTLLAKIEDYYADGARADDLVNVSAAQDIQTLVQGIDAEGNQAIVKPDVKTIARVHTLGKNGRVALITLLSYSNRGIGETVRLEIDKRLLPNTQKKLYLLDHISGEKQPITDKITVDTTISKNAAVFEIVEE